MPRRQSPGGRARTFDYWKIEGFKQESGQWVVLEPQWRDTRYIHGDLDSELEKNWKYRITALDHSGNASPPSAETGFGKMKKAGSTFLSSAVNETLAQVTQHESTLSTHSTLISQNSYDITLKADQEQVDTLSGNVSTLSGEVNVLAGQVSLAVKQDGATISSFVAGVSGLRLEGPSIKITGSTEFASGYDPSSKLTATGGAYNSAESGARVRIFPDAYTGIRIIDDNGADVFKALVGGTDVGDVQIGSADSHYLLFDKSTGNMVTNATFQSNIGGGVSDEEGIVIGRVGSGNHAEIQVHSGAWDVVMGKLGGAGTGPNGEGSAHLWLKREGWGEKVNDQVLESRSQVLNLDL